MSKRLKIIACSCVILLIVLLPIFGRLYENYKKSKIEKLEDMQQKNKAYAEWLFLEGEFEVTTNRVNVGKMTSNETKTQIAIYYYNYYSGKNVQYDMLIKEYDAFCEGNSKCNNLAEYTDFLNQSETSEFKDGLLQKVSINAYIQQCSKLIMVAYGVDVDSGQEDMPLSYEQIMKLCEIAVENSKEIYIMGVVEDLGVVSKMKVPLLYSDFDETDLEVDSHGGYVINVDDTIGYVTERTDILSGDKQWMVTKIEIAEKDSFFNVCKCCLGNTTEDIRTKMDDFGYGFNLEDENDEKLVYTREFFKITYELDNGCCSKIIVELVE
ncbi:MAG: hypothetical protein IJO70_07035 [Lachnospiraceae bacterium]|nr:hypothetical protein [Lachnospiraceae bacterium]